LTSPGLGRSCKTQAKRLETARHNAQMHPNALLELATDLLHQVLQFQSPADRVVSDFFRTHRLLGSRERHTLAETTYAVLRERLLFGHLAQSGKGEMARRLVVLAWRGNEGFLRAALSEPEQQWLARVQGVNPSSLAEHLRHNLPEWLVEQLQSQLGDQFWPLVNSLNQTAPLDLRVNTFKAKREEVQTALEAAGMRATCTPYSPWGLRIEGKPALNKLEAFAQGHMEVQDEGSQLLALLVDAKRSEMVADFCAGAGGKTLALGASMRNTGRLYAFDTSGHRLAALKPRLARSGLSNVYPIQIAHERDERIKRLAGKIDRVLVDAPCSGLGTLRRNPDMKWRQSPTSVEELRAKQSAILQSAARLVKPGGRLVYATCSHSTSSQTLRFKALPVAELLAKAHVTDADKLVNDRFLRLWPHQHGTDGFFAAVWERI
jgi:16S rRNA (cytosine967-C5)-methyltransferase